MDLGLTGKGAIVTGGSRGIGRAIAEAFADAGANVAICARGGESLAAARDSLVSKGVGVYAATCDVADGDALADFIAEAGRALGAINVLVNNASGHGQSNDEPGWKAVIDVDLMATVRGCRAAVPLIEAAGGGSLIHISSIAGLSSSPLIPYASIKAALMQLARSQALAFAPMRIRVNCIAPGSTEFPGGVWDRIRRDQPQVYDAAVAGIPWGRMGQPEEIADVAVFLASERANWVTGQTIAVDGGQALRPIGTVKEGR